MMMTLQYQRSPHLINLFVFYRRGFVPDKDFRNSSVVDLFS